jgi:glycosyltransferase involved in cell wall biosynthesis
MAGLARPEGRPELTVSLVIPVRNEARNIAWVLEQIVDDVHEIILVDGDSTDATLTTARSYRSDLTVIPQQGAGKGSALRTGFLAATGDVIVMMDADGSMSPQEIRHYVHFLANGYDFVKGSRFVCGGGSLDITRFRRLGNRFLLDVFNMLYGGDLTDLCYGFCAFHRRYLEHLDLTATGFEIEAEMTVRAMQAGLRIAEVPSLELPRRAGESNLHAIRDGWRVLNTLVGSRNHRPRVSRPNAEFSTPLPLPAATPRPARRSPQVLLRRAFGPRAGVHADYAAPSLVAAHASAAGPDPTEESKVLSG